MPTLSDLRQSKFLTKQDVTPPVLVTISGYDQLNVALEGAEPEMKWVLHFTELEKPLCLNSTNGSIIAAITSSEDFDNWIGKKVVLYNDPSIAFRGKVTGGIRVRAPRNQPAPVPVVAQTPAVQKPNPAQTAVPAPAAEPDGDPSVPF